MFSKPVEEKEDHNGNASPQPSFSEDKLARHPIVLKLVNKILTNALFKEDPKYRSINSSIIERKCTGSGDFSLLCDVLGYAGFVQTADEGVARWSLPVGCHLGHLLSVLEKIRTALAKPKDIGELICQDVKSWIQKHPSQINANSNPVQVSFVNESYAPLVIRRVDYDGNERRTNNDRLKPRAQVTVESPLDHTFIVRDKNGDPLCAYKPVLESSGHHIVTIGDRGAWLMTGRKAATGEVLRASKLRAAVVEGLRKSLMQEVSKMPEPDDISAQMAAGARPGNLGPIVPAAPSGVLGPIVSAGGPAE